MLRKNVLVVSLFLLVVNVYADVPTPEEKPNRVKRPAVIDTYLSIRLDSEAKEARLIIPRAQAKALRAEFASTDEESDKVAAMLASDSSISRLQMIVSGVFLSLALAFAGIWFNRNGTRTSGTRAVSAAGMVIFAFGGFAVAVYGNAGPPAEARSITGKMFAPALHVYKFGGGKIKLEISDTETQPVLIVPDARSAPSE